MNRKDFGKLITALRKEHTDPDDKVWTQEQLANETNLSHQQIGDIERGEKANIEPDTILALAKALELTTTERKEFFLAASGVENEDIAPNNVPVVVLNEMLQIIKDIHLPALIMDAYGELVAINQGTVTLYRLDMDDFQNSSINQATKFNFMRLVFSEEFESQRTMMGESWTTFANETVAIFRTISFRYRASAYFRYILPELRKFKLFRKYWETAPYQEYKQYLDNAFFCANIPDVGS